MQISLRTVAADLKKKIHNWKRVMRIFLFKFCLAMRTVASPLTFFFAYFSTPIYKKVHIQMFNCKLLFACEYEIYFLEFTISPMSPISIVYKVIYMPIMGSS